MFHFFNLFNFLCLVNAAVFPTTFGECNLEIFKEEINEIPELVDIIKYETKRLTNQLGPIDKHPFSIYIINNKNEFIEKAGTIPEWGIAVAKMDPDRIIMQSTSLANISYKRMKKILIHELNHIYMFRLPNYQTIPSWFKEGMAMTYSNEFTMFYKLEISRAILDNEIIPLNNLNYISNFKKDKVRLAYAESAAGIDLIKNYYGTNALTNIMSFLHYGNNFDKALKNITGEDLLIFQDKFEKFLNDNYNWIFLIQVYKYIYVILPLIQILGFIFKRYRNKKILKLWNLEEELEDIKWKNNLHN